MRKVKTKITHIALLIVLMLTALGGLKAQQQPIFTWRAHANLLYRNWLNWVYQMTPYDTDEIPHAIQELHAGTWDLAGKFDR